jgi:hypothetical protein
MNATYSPEASDLIFPPQAPFSWTLRWARKHGAAKTRVAASTYRIEGSAANDEELAAAVAFCERHGASLERD